MVTHPSPARRKKGKKFYLSGHLLRPLLLRRRVHPVLNERLAGVGRCIRRRARGHEPRRVPDCHIPRRGQRLEPGMSAGSRRRRSARARGERRVPTPDGRVRSLQRRRSEAVGAKVGPAARLGSSRAGSRGTRPSRAAATDEESTASTGTSAAPTFDDAVDQQTARDARSRPASGAASRADGERNALLEGRTAAAGQEGEEGAIITARRAGGRGDVATAEHLRARPTVCARARDATGVQHTGGAARRTGRFNARVADGSSRTRAGGGTYADAERTAGNGRGSFFFVCVLVKTLCGTRAVACDGTASACLATSGDEPCGKLTAAKWIEHGMMYRTRR